MQFKHKALPELDNTEESRQDFVKSFKLYLATKIAPGNKLTYETQAKPLYRKKYNADPVHRKDVNSVMKNETFYQMWGSLQRSSQEMMWKACQIPISRHWEKSHKPTVTSKPKHGSLILNHELKTPSYLSAVDIHCQPGGYDWEKSDNDTAAGAIYDQGVYIYAMGRMGPLNDDIGLSQASYIRDHMPTIKPKKILDLGCAVGHSTIPYKTVFPDAEVHAIDIGAPVLRYAHARAESLETSVYFSQQNAEQTNFSNSSFDLIVSHILLHETSTKAISNIMNECHRLLKPGGWMIHSETPPYANMDPFDAFILDWDAKHNNEPFWSASHELDPREIAETSGFNENTVFEIMAPSAFELSKSKRTNIFQGGDFGGAGLWYIFGMQK